MEIRNYIAILWRRKWVIAHLSETPTVEWAGKLTYPTKLVIEPQGKGEKIMKKRHLLVMAVLVVAMSLVIVVPSSACEHGCTPGYWKQPHHFDSWEATGYSPSDSFHDVFGVDPDMTLLEALEAKGGGENAMMRHAVAALLNAAHPEVVYFPECLVIGNVQKWWQGVYTAEELKDFFEEFNEYGCPLD